MKKLLYLFLLIALGCENPIDSENKKINLELKLALEKCNVSLNEYQLASKKSNLGNILDINRIEGDYKLVESNKIISNAKKRLGKISIANNNFSKRINILLNSLKVSNNTKENEIEKVKNVYKKNIENRINAFKSDSSLLASSGKIINLLQYECRYKISEGQLFFYDQPCISKYNEYSWKFQSLLKSIEMDAHS